MKLEQFEQNVTNWSHVRGIYTHSDTKAQALKAVSEMGELADAVIKGDKESLKDAIGDVLVCLQNVCVLESITFDECMDRAWSEIKDRKGRMVAGGAFVKD